MEETRIILQGIRIDRKLKIHDGITLTPLPNSTEKPVPISPGLPTIIMEEPKSYLGRVLLRKAKSKEFSVATFLQHLSLVCNNAVHPVKEWLQSNTSDPSGLSVHSYRDDPRWPTVDISESHISETKKQLLKFTKLDRHVQKKLEIAIPRWVKSKTEKDVDRIIDLGIAFEVLYLSDSSEQQQLSLTFRLRAAWHLGSGLEERRELMKSFNSIYKARSKAVHRGNFSANRAILAEADRLYRRVIKKFIDDGNFPDWDSLVVGGTGKHNSKDKWQLEASEP